MSALAITENTHHMIRQLALPLIPERRVKGALHLVSRDTGVSYSKLRKIYYRLTSHILAVEWQAIQAAHSKWLLSQEQRLSAELAQLRALRTARKQGELFNVTAKDGACSVAKAADQSAADT